MCGRYYIAPPTDNDLLEALLSTLARRGGDRPKLGEVFPGDKAAVIANNKKLVPTPFVMRWGFRVDKKLIINARWETAHLKPLFRDSLSFRRCAIPATSYFEWTMQGEKAKYAISVDEVPLLYLAGLYRPEAEDPAFTVLTKDAAPQISFIHPRMPILLLPDQVPQWLSPEGDFRALAENSLPLKWHLLDDSAKQP